LLDFLSVQRACGGGAAQQRRGGRRGKMHIKQLTIEGFKTYKNLTVLDPFDPKVNVIMGKNGSGKV
jgi:hypothetical protein